MFLSIRKALINGKIIVTILTTHREEIDGPAGSALRRAIAEVKQLWSVIRWITKSLLSRAPPCFGRHVKPLVSVAFAVVSIYSSFKEG
jgi:hypothetical protein